MDGKIKLPPVDGKIRFPDDDIGLEITLLKILGGGGPPWPPLPRDTFCCGIGRLGKSCSTDVAEDAMLIFVLVPALEVVAVLAFNFDLGIGTFGN